MVEVDETFVGGKETNKHANKRSKGGPGGWRMEPVVTLVERDGSARSFHVANVTSETLRPITVQTADRASHLMTDGATIYSKVGKEFAAHSVLDHAAGEYARMGFHHSNTVENYFSMLKRGVTGVYSRLDGPSGPLPR